MKLIGRIISRVGIFAALCGVVSSIIHFFDYELRILMWIDHWGPGPAWGIRIGCLVGGVAMFLVGDVLSGDARARKEAQAAAKAAPPLPGNQDPPG